MHFPDPLSHRAIVSFDVRFMHATETELAKDTGLFLPAVTTVRYHAASMQACQCPYRGLTQSCLLSLTGMTGASTTRIINELLKLQDADCKQHANRNSQPVLGNTTQPSTQIPSEPTPSLHGNHSKQSTPLSPQQTTPPTSTPAPLAPISCTALGLRAAHSVGLLPYLFPKVFDHLVS